MNSSKWLIVLGLAVAAVAYLIVGWPIQRAINGYSAAYDAVDQLAMCQKAGEVADAWAGIGSTSRYEEWKSKEFGDCTLARAQMSH